jgi:D-3-phosphoglycerate dehydrogenase
LVREGNSLPDTRSVQQHIVEERTDVAAIEVILVSWSKGDCPQTWMDWMTRELPKLGAEFKIARSMTPEELERNASDADIIVVGDSRLTPESLAVVPKCRAVICMGSGVDSKVELPVATERGIVVVNTPQGVTETVSDHAIAMMFAITRRLLEQDRLVRDGTWDKWAAPPSRHFRGAALGLVAFGRIPRAMVRKLAGFDMKVIAYDPYVPAEVAADYGVRLVGLDEVMSSSDFVSVHCPLTEATFHLIGERELSLMKGDAVLVNIARGPVLDEGALYTALTEGWIAGAALDVLEQEPPDPANPLFQLPNVIITPHAAGLSDLFPGDIWKATYESIRDLIEHRWPESVVNRHEVKPRWELH